MTDDHLPIFFWPPAPLEEQLREIIEHADQVAHVLSLYHATSPVLLRYNALRERILSP